MAAHTPGPWIILDDEAVHPVLRNVRIIGGGANVLDRYQIASNIQGDANAALIAAAPELLAALRLHMEFLDSLPAGWLGKTTGDVGLLNDALIASGKIISKLKQVGAA